MAKYRVKLSMITWDDGKGEYDVSDLPRTIESFIEASNKDEAIEQAMLEATEDEGSLIEGVHEIEIERLRK